MRLPRENVLDVLRCVDFATLLALQRSSSALYGVVRRNQSLLPRLRVFHLYLGYSRGAYALREIVGDDNSIVLKSRASRPLAEDVDYSFLRTFRDEIGTHFLDSAWIVWTGGPRMRKELDMQKVVEGLPALKHIRELSLECGGPWNRTFTIDRDLIERLVMKPLENLQALNLYDVNIRIDWAFLRDEWALRLRWLSVAPHIRIEDAFPEIDSSDQAEILEYCTDFAHLPKGKSKIVRIFNWRISREFLKRIIKAVVACNDWLTVVLRGAPGFTENDADYVRSDLAPENKVDGIITNVRYSSRIGSHRIFVRTYPDACRSVAVTNNPFITTWSDTWKRDAEAF